VELKINYPLHIAFSVPLNASRLICRSGTWQAENHDNVLAGECSMIIAKYAGLGRVGMGF
jgi:hypothetical protein